jgi:hypothetical protein
MNSIFTKLEGVKKNISLIYFFVIPVFLAGAVAENWFTIVEKSISIWHSKKVTDIRVANSFQVLRGSFVVLPINVSIGKNTITVEVSYFTNDENAKASLFSNTFNGLNESRFENIISNKSNIFKYQYANLTCDTSFEFVPRITYSNGATNTGASFFVSTAKCA